MSLLLRHLEAHGPLTRADLEAALRRQQQAGGSLDTALLELGLLPPLALDACLQAACGLPGAPVRLLERGPTRPWEHVPKDLVDIGWAMPLAAEDGRLIVAVHPDLPDAKLGQLYRLIRGFYPVVAPECCLAKIAAERTGAILAPRYALILLDYLEALRSTAVTVEYDGGITDVPVPTDRQLAGPRPAATMTGPTASAVGDGVEAPHVASDGVEAASDAASPAPSRRDTLIGARPAPPDRDAVPPVSSDMRPGAPSPADEDAPAAVPPVSSDMRPGAPSPTDEDAPAAAPPVSSDRQPGDAPTEGETSLHVSQDMHASDHGEPVSQDMHLGDHDAPVPADGDAPITTRPAASDTPTADDSAPASDRTSTPPGDSDADLGEDAAPPPRPAPDRPVLLDIGPDGPTLVVADDPNAPEPVFGPFGTTLVPGSLRATDDPVTPVASDRGFGPIATTIVPGSLAAGDGSSTPVASDRGFRLAGAGAHAESELSGTEASPDASDPASPASDSPVSEAALRADVTQIHGTEAETSQPLPGDSSAPAHPADAAAAHAAGVASEADRATGEAAVTASDEPAAPHTSTPCADDEPVPSDALATTPVPSETSSAAQPIIGEPVPSDIPSSPVSSVTSATAQPAPDEPAPSDASAAADLGSPTAPVPSGTSTELTAGEPASSDTLTSARPIADEPVPSDTSADGEPISSDTFASARPIADEPVPSDTSAESADGEPISSDTLASARPIVDEPAPSDTSAASTPSDASASLTASGPSDTADTLAASLPAEGGPAPGAEEPVSLDSTIAPDASPGASAPAEGAGAEVAPGVASTASDQQAPAPVSSDSVAPTAAESPTGRSAELQLSIEPPPGFTTLAIAPDAPLIVTGPLDPAEFEGSTGALAIAPDTPLIVLPPTTGVHARASVVAVPLTERRTPTSPLPASAGGPAAEAAGARNTSASARAAEHRPDARHEPSDRSSALTPDGAQPGTSDRSSALTAEGAQPAPSDRVAASHPGGDQPDASGTSSALAASAEATDACAAEPASSDRTQPGDATSAAAHEDGRTGEVVTRSAASDEPRPGATASVPKDSQATRLVQSTTRTPPTTPKPMVMTLAQRLDAARVALANAEGRDRITEALVRAAALIAPRVALFGVKREGLRVLAAPGSALRLAEGNVIPLPENGLLDRAVSGQGPMHLLIEPTLSSAVGQPLGIPCIFEPVLAGGRTVLMLYLDRAGVAFDPRERVVVRELCDIARQSLEALLRLLGWVVPDSQRSGNPNDPTRPVVRPHLAKPVVRVDETEPPATDPPLPVAPAPPGGSPAAADEPRRDDAPAPSDSSSRDRSPADDASPSPDSPAPSDSSTDGGPPSVADDASPSPDSPAPSVSSTRGGPPTAADDASPSLARPASSDRSRDHAPPLSREPLAGPGDSASASRSRGRGSRGRAVITLVNPIRREEASTVAPLPARLESSSATNPPPSPASEDSDAHDTPPAQDRQPPDGPGLGLAPVPVPLGPEADDSPLVARFAALAARADARGQPAPVTPVWMDRTDRAGSIGHAPSDMAKGADDSPARPQVDMPAWIATPEPSGIEDPLPVASSLLSAGLTSAAGADLDPAATIPGAARIRLDEPEIDARPLAASETPTVLDLSPPPSHEPPSLEPRAAPDAPTVLDIQPLDPAAAPLIPHLIAPPGTPGAGRRRRPVDEPETEPVLVIPKTLRRSSGLAATPHPMARRERNETDEVPTLTMPPTLINPRSGRRRGKHEPRPEAPTDALTMPRLIRQAPSEEPSGEDRPDAAAQEHVSEDMLDKTGTEGHVLTDSRDAGGEDAEERPEAVLAAPEAGEPSAREQDSTTDDGHAAAGRSSAELDPQDADGADESTDTLATEGSTTETEPTPSESEPTDKAAADADASQADKAAADADGPQTDKPTADADASQTADTDPQADKPTTDTDPQADEPTTDTDASQTDEPTTDTDASQTDKPTTDAAGSKTDKPTTDADASQAPDPDAASPRSDREIDAAIAAFLRDPSEPPGVGRLRALGERGLARLVARFPGPIDLANATNFPPPSAHGPLLRACIELGPPVSPYVLELFANVRPQIRFYAAFLFQELRDPQCLRPLGELAFDPDADVRLIATRVLESYSRTPEFAAVATRIRDELDSRERERQVLAVEATGTLRDTRAVPRLIDLLAVRDKHIREAALEALCSITAKHHGYRTARWRAWYEEHGQEPRIEWVIDGLRHRDIAVRRWAADELARITGQRIPFPADGDRRSRDLALRAWQEWWDEHREEFSAAP